MSDASIVDRVDRAVASVGDVVSRAPWPVAGRRVTWHREWDDELDAAAARLADRLGLDVELHRAAAAPRAGVRKRHASVHHGDSVVAVLSLRRRGTYWEPVTEGCLPLAEVLAEPEEVGPALRATRLDIRLEEVPAELVERLSPDRVWERMAYRAELGDHEAAWRSSRRFWRNLRNVRNRTAHLQVRTGERSDIEPIVRLWARVWADDPLLAPVAADDMVAVYAHLHARGTLQTAVLLEGDRIVGGAINTLDGDVVYGLCMARERDHPVKGLGTRVIEEGFAIAEATGAGEFDLLGGLDYKHRWAPIEVPRYVVEYVPGWLRIYRIGRGGLGRMKDAVRTALDRARRTTDRARGSDASEPA